MTEIKIEKKIKKLTVFLVIASLLILVVGFLASRSLYSSFRNTIATKISLEIERYKEELKRKTEADIKTLETLAGFLEFGADLSTDKFLYGLYSSNNNTGFIRMGYFNDDGTGMRVNLNGIMESKVYKSDLNINLQNIIDESLKTGEVSVSGIYYDAKIDENIISYAVPVELQPNEYGTLVVSEKMYRYTEVLDGGSLISKDGFVACINDDGQILIGSSNIDDLDDRFVNDKNNGLYVSDAIKSKISELGDKQGKTSIMIDGTSYYIVKSPVEIKDIYILLIDKEKNISGPLYNNMIVTQGMGIILVLMTVISILLGYSKIKGSYRELVNLAYYDQLTGTYNMAKFKGILKERKAFKKSCIVVLDVRNFKFINEIFGEEQSNKLLCHMANVITANLSDNEFFCREVADRFFIFMQKEDRTKLANRINNIMDEICKMKLNAYKTYPIVIYCGVSTIRAEDEMNIQEFETKVMFALRQAKLYQEKYGIQNKICFYDNEIHKKEQLENYIESNMEQALIKNEFRLFLQPKNNLKNNKLGGAEALVRWTTSEGKMIFPDQFIPLFEENGFCARLDLYMFEKVCQKLREWIDKGLKPIPISVNQSKLLFYENDYVEQLTQITDKYRISPKLLTLEILEGLALGDSDTLNIRVIELKQKGFRLSMDDFGSGYSSLNVLGRIDIDELKIDRGFLLEASKKDGHRQRIIMEQIITLARKMNISTVVEGVETAQDEELIKKLGCDFGQGYFYNKPISAEDFEKLYIE